MEEGLHGLMKVAQFVVTSTWYGRLKSDIFKQDHHTSWLYRWNVSGSTLPSTSNVIQQVALLIMNMSTQIATTVAQIMPDLAAKLKSIRGTGSVIKNTLLMDLSILSKCIWTILTAVLILFEFCSSKTLHCSLPPSPSVSHIHGLREQLVFHRMVQKFV